MDIDLIKSVRGLESTHDEIMDRTALSDIMYQYPNPDQDEKALLSNLVPSTEGFTDIVKSIHGKLNGVAWDYFIDSLDNSRAQAENKLNRVRYLKSKMSKQGKVGGVGSVPYQLQYSTLELKGNVPSPREMITALNELRKIVYSETLDEMEFILRISSKMVPEVERLLRGIQVNNENMTLSTFLGAIAELGNVATIRRNNLPYLRPAMDIDGNNVYTSIELPGNARIVSTQHPYDIAAIRAVGLPQFRAVSAIFSMRTSLDKRTYRSQPPDVLPKLSELEITRIIEAIESICTSIIKFKIRYGNNFSSSKRNFSKMRDTLDRTARGGENVESKIYLRKAADTVHATARWIHTPVMPIIGHSLRVCTALISYVDACLRE